MSTDYSAIARQVPRWAFAFLAMVLAGVLLYSSWTECTFEIAGYGFGPKKNCSPEPPPVQPISDESAVEGMPLGSIVQSIMPPADYLTKELQAAWLPADGRDTPRDSLYWKTFQQKTLPDLRAMFLRGANKFTDTRGPRTDAWKDEAPRDPNGYQLDAFKSHSHTEGGVLKKVNEPGEAEEMHGSPDVIMKDQPSGATGENETRPKNVAVFYYVKVN